MNTNTVKMPKGDFDSFVAKKGLEAFTKPQMDAWVTKNAELFTKATTNDFDEGESARFDEFKAELQSFTMIEVISKAENNAPLKHELMYVRESQVDWDETDDISKGGDNIEKARSGVYKDTQLNRKLGRVGQRFGGTGAKKEDGGGKPESKPDSTGNVSDNIKSSNFYNGVQAKLSINLKDGKTMSANVLDSDKKRYLKKEVTEKELVGKYFKMDNGVVKYSNPEN